MIEETPAKTILLLDKDTGISNRLTALLSEHGFTVIRSTSFSEVKKQIQQEEIDCILSDIGIAEERAGSFPEDIPVICIYDNDSPTGENLTEIDSCYCCFNKDTPPPVLIDTIGRAISLYERLRTKKQKKKQYRNIIDSLEDIVYSIDMKTEEFTYLSPAFKRLLGYTLDDVQRMGGRKKFLSKVIQYGAFQEQLRALVEFFEGKDKRPRHVSMWKGKDGATRVLEDYWVPVYEKGELIVVDGVLRDITDTKRLKDSLAESRDTYKILVDHLPLAVFEIDEKGTILTINKELANWIGEDPEELVGRNMEEFFPGETLERRKAYVEKAFREGRQQTFTDTAGERVFQHMVVPISSGGHSRVLIVAEDITEQHFRQREAEQHRLFWESVFKSSPDAIVVLDHENAILGWNSGAEVLFGYTAEEVLGRDLDSLITGGEAEKQSEAQEITKRTLEGQNVSNFETVRYRKDGTPVDVRIAGAPVLIEGSLSGVVGIYTDISERKKAEEALQRSLEEKNFLMKEINHRVKNNLVMISSLINLKSTSQGGNLDLSDLEHQIDAIRIVHENLYQSDEILRIGFHDYVQDLLETVFSSFTEEHVEIVNSIGDYQLPTKIVVPLGLIVNEIATNAIKYGFNSGSEYQFTVDLEKDEDAGQFTFTAENTGAPFPEDIDFDNPETLGLRLISALVSQLHGTVELRRKPNPLFTIRFPLSE